MDIAQIYNKLFTTGQLIRIPKKPEHRDLLLATLSLPLERRYPYTELELNDVLRQELGAMNALVDHVSARRYLVDFGFVKRDAAGQRYFLNFLKQQEILPEPRHDEARTALTSAITNAPQARHGKDKK